MYYLLHEVQTSDAARKFIGHCGNVLVKMAENK
jgi:hypothetical protein